MRKRVSLARIDSSYIREITRLVAHLWRNISSGGAKRERPLYKSAGSYKRNNHGYLCNLLGGIKRVELLRGLVGGLAEAFQGLPVLNG